VHEQDDSWSDIYLLFLKWHARSFVSSDQGDLTTSSSLRTTTSVCSRILSLNLLQTSSWYPRLPIPGAFRPQTRKTWPSSRYCTLAQKSLEGSDLSGGGGPIPMPAPSRTDSQQQDCPEFTRCTYVQCCSFILQMKVFSRCDLP
jgi:hypothetical protein